MLLSDFEVVKKKPPHDNSIWIKIVAHIRHNETGEIRLHKTDGIWDEDENRPHTWIWEEGNFSCDCNRKLFWGDANNEDHWDDSPCSDGKFSVSLENPKTGRLFYIEKHKP